MSQEMQAASRSWKRQEDKFSLRVSRKGHHPVDILILALGDRQNNGSKVVPILTSGTCESVTLHGSRNFSDD